MDGASISILLGVRVHLGFARYRYRPVCPLIDDKLRHNIVKVAVNSDNVITRSIFNKRTDVQKTDVNLFFFNNKTPKWSNAGNKL